MLTQDDFNNPYPEGYGYLRIGTPVNADINKCNINYNAFDMSMLANENALVMNLNTTGTKQIIGGGKDAKAQDAWGVSSDTKLSLKSGFVDAALAFHINKSKNLCNHKAENNISAVASQEGSIALLKSFTGNKILECATPLFREKITAIRNADNIQKLQTALIDFYKYFGTGFISELTLGSIGVFNGTAQYADSSVERNQNIGGSISVSTLYGGASEAFEYTNKNMNANAEGSFRCTSFGMPNKSACHEWVDGFLNQFAGNNLSKIANLESWQSAFNAKVAESPEPKIKEKAPNKDPLPSYKINNLEEAIKKMKAAEFTAQYKKDHGGAIPPASAYDDFLKSLKDAAKMDDNDVNKGDNKKLAFINNIQPSSTDTNYKITFDNIGIDPGFYMDPREVNKDDDVIDIDFGGYGITGFNYCPWEDIFPEFKNFQEQISASQITVGYIMIWLSIRSMFSQYFKFCANFPEIAPYYLVPSTVAYDKSIDDIIDYIFTLLTSISTTSFEICTELENKFRDLLLTNGFQMFDCYDYLIKNYEWLKQVPYGAVALVDYNNSSYLYRSYDDYKIMFAPKSSSTDIAPVVLNNNPIRLYPIISVDKDSNPYFVWTTLLKFYSQSGSYEYAGGITNCLEKYDYSFNAFRIALNNCAMYLSPWYNARPDFKDIKEISDKISNIIKIIPDESSYKDHIWKLQKTSEGKNPDCLMYIYNKMADTELMLLSGLGKDIIINDKITPQPYFKECKHLDIYLLPLNYREIELSNVKSLTGPIPMWIEPRTNELVEKLNKLAEN